MPYSSWICYVSRKALWLLLTSNGTKSPLTFLNDSSSSSSVPWKGANSVGSTPLAAANLLMASSSELASIGPTLVPMKFALICFHVISALPLNCS